MDKLFEIPEDYWINFISDESENMYIGQDPNTPKTPEPSRICESLSQFQKTIFLTCVRLGYW